MAKPSTNPIRSTSTHQGPDSRATQRGRILNLLISGRGGWVPSPDLARLALQYNSRLLECRKLGFQIESRVKKVDGARHSWFRLVSGPTAADASPTAPLDDRIDSRTPTTTPTNSVRRERDNTLPLFPEAHR
jgi:hypothetical protein